MQAVCEIATPVVVHPLGHAMHEESAPWLVSELYVFGGHCVGPVLAGQ